MLKIEEHGGGCCGINHIHDFGGRPGRNRDQLWRDCNENRLCLEVVLTDAQGVLENHKRFLEEFGFEHTVTFTNPHSQNECYVFHRVPRNQRNTAREQAELVPAAPPVPPAPPRPARPNRWILYRLKFDENGFESDQTYEVCRFGAARPPQEMIDQAVRGDKNGAELPRARYALRHVV